MLGRYRDMGVDLGTANTLVYIKNRGVVVHEPSVVALDTHTRSVLAVGEEAKRMVGRTPGSIVAVRPLKDGVIADFETTEKMLRHFIRRAMQGGGLFRPRVVIGVPSGVTEVEKRAVIDAALSLGGIVAHRSIRVAGDELDEAIIQHVRRTYNVLLGERTAEQVKQTIGTAFPPEEEMTMEVRGRDLVTGLPKTITLTSQEIR